MVCILYLSKGKQLQEDIIMALVDENNTEIIINTKLAYNWVFKQNEFEEAVLVQALSSLGVKTGITANEFQYIFPIILRMMKSNSEWVK